MFVSPTGQNVVLNLYLMWFKGDVFEVKVICCVCSRSF